MAESKPEGLTSLLQGLTPKRDSKVFFVLADGLIVSVQENTAVLSEITVKERGKSLSNQVSDYRIPENTVLRATLHEWRDVLTVKTGELVMTNKEVKT